MPRVGWRRATEEVAGRDRALASLIRRRGPVRIPKPITTHFEALVESILYQQLAGAAAAAIHGRLVALVPDGLTPEALLAVPEARLRGAGLSGAKAASVRDLAAKVLEGTVPLEGIQRLRDDDIVERLSAVRGIGRWTAEMFLIFQLRRMDVWPVDDYGVRQGWALSHRAQLPAPRELHAAGERFRPYRTIVAWYCWEAVHESRERPGGRSVRCD